MTAEVAEPGPALGIKERVQERDRREHEEPNVVSFGAAGKQKAACGGDLERDPIVQRSMKGKRTAL